MQPTASPSHSPPKQRYTKPRNEPTAETAPIRPLGSEWGRWHGCEHPWAVPTLPSRQGYGSN
eukprot:3762551-Lingulodinium_polyedra.AAC.1